MVRRNVHRDAYPVRLQRNALQGGAKHPRRNGNCLAILFIVIPLLAGRHETTKSAINAFETDTQSERIMFFGPQGMTEPGMALKADLGKPCVREAWPERNHHPCRGWPVYRRPAGKLLEFWWQLRDHGSEWHSIPRIVWRSDTLYGAL